MIAPCLLSCRRSASCSILFRRSDLAAPVALWDWMHCWSEDQLAASASPTEQQDLGRSQLDLPAPANWRHFLLNFHFWNPFFLYGGLRGSGLHDRDFIIRAGVPVASFTLLFRGLLIFLLFPRTPWPRRWRGLPSAGFPLAPWRLPRRGFWPRPRRPASAPRAAQGFLGLPRSPPWVPTVLAWFQPQASPSHAAWWWRFPGRSRRWFWRPSTRRRPLQSSHPTLRTSRLLPAELLEKSATRGCPFSWTCIPSSRPSWRLPPPWPPGLSSTWRHAPLGFAGVSLSPCTSVLGVEWRGRIDGTYTMYQHVRRLSWIHLPGRAGHPSDGMPAPSCGVPDSFRVLLRHKAVFAVVCDSPLKHIFPVVATGWVCQEILPSDPSFWRDWAFCSARFVPQQLWEGSWRRFLLRVSALSSSDLHPFLGLLGLQSKPPPKSLFRVLLPREVAQPGFFLARRTGREARLGSRFTIVLFLPTGRVKSFWTEPSEAQKSKFARGGDQRQCGGRRRFPSIFGPKSPIQQETNLLGGDNFDRGTMFFPRIEEKWFLMIGVPWTRMQTRKRFPRIP